MIEKAREALKLGITELHIVGGLHPSLPFSYYVDMLRSLKELDIEKVTVSDAELKLAMQLIDQISQDTYDPTMFEDEEKKRILSAIDEKIAGKQVVAAEHVEPNTGAQVIDLMEALRASLGTRGGAKAKPAPAKAVAAPVAAEPAKERKGVKRAAKVEEVAVAAPVRARAKK